MDRLMEHHLLTDKHMIMPILTTKNLVIYLIELMFLEV